MLNVPVYNEAGQQIGQESIDPQHLGGKVNPSLLKQAVVAYQANARQGTVAQKTRAEVQGASRKLYKQKGTGRARTGNLRNPIKRGGGAPFPRKTRDFGRDLPRQMRRLARNHAVLSKIEKSEVLIVEPGAFDVPKTKRLATMLKAVKVDKSCLLATRGVDPMLYKSGRNLPTARIIDVAEMNALDVLLRRRLIFTREAFAAFRDSVSKSGKAAD